MTDLTQDEIETFNNAEALTPAVWKIVAKATDWDYDDFQRQLRWNQKLEVFHAAADIIENTNQ